LKSPAAYRRTSICRWITNSVLQDMRNSQFKNFRRLHSASAFGSPILLFAAYLCLADGLIWWALLPSVVGLAFTMALPFQSLADPKDTKSENEFPKWAGRIATYFCLLWLGSLPEFWTLFERFQTDGTLLDWRLIAAGGIWTSSAVYSNCRLIARLSDDDIFSYLNKEPR
jgi:hypothetical protein